MASSILTNVYDVISVLTDIQKCKLLGVDTEFPLLWFN